MKQEWPAPERNKQPILAVLQRVLGASGRLLEVSSGSGQHAVFFAERLAGWQIEPSDMDAENLASIRAWVEEKQLPNLCSPRTLDVLAEDWDVGQVDAIFNANMIHIAPFECCVALMRGVGRHLRPDGTLILYGPYRIAGQHTSPSNAEFDEGLKRRNPDWGVRDLEAVSALALAQGLSLIERVAMPANNQTLIFRAQR